MEFQYLGLYITTGIDLVQFNTFVFLVGKKTQNFINNTNYCIKWVCLLLSPCDTLDMGINNYLPISAIPSDWYVHKINYDSSYHLIFGDKISEEYLQYILL